MRMINHIFRRSATTFVKIQADGWPIRVAVRASYAHKPQAVDRLERGLAEILLRPSQSAIVESLRHRRDLPIDLQYHDRIYNSGVIDTDTSDIGKHVETAKEQERLQKGQEDTITGGAWELDDDGAVIHRHIRLYEPSQLSETLHRINEVAEELHHEPHTHVDGLQVTISCTTHAPPGLSMKDVKLARKIDEILMRVAMDNNGEQGWSIDVSPEHKQHAIRKNMGTIEQAKKSCACG